MSHIITRSDIVGAMYYSEQLGRDYGAPHGGWTADKTQATQFTDAQSAQEHIDSKILEPERLHCQPMEIKK